MKKVASSELKDNIGKYLDLVLVEREICITRHNRVIAKLIAAFDENEDIEDMDSHGD